MPDRTITTDATARREAPAETAVVELAARGEGDTATTARATARDRAATVRNALADAHATPRTVESRVEEGDELFGVPDDVPFQATERLEVDCDPETAEDVVLAAVDAGATVRAVRFGLHDETRRALEDEALAAATVRAREKAARIADAEGLTLGTAREVTTTDAASGMESIVDEALASTPDGDFQPDPVAVEAAVEATYMVADE